MKHLWLMALLIPSVVHGAIGSVTGLQGSAAEIKRGSAAVKVQSKTGVESMDTVQVGSKAQVDITFVDETKVKITENSRLVLDDFVYDPKKSDAGKLGMRVALGTVRYTSGQIAKNNAQNVNIKTPTATIAVRGTDFAMTVDEVGRSIIVLLPSCQDDREVGRYEISGNCTVGQIDVETAAGMVSLNQPFTATMVTDSGQPPIPPAPVEQVLANVNNDQILRPPLALVEAAAEQEKTKKRRRYPNTIDPDAEEWLAIEEEGTVRTDQRTVIIQQEEQHQQKVSDDKTNPCAPFDSCGNERSLNWYLRVDEEKGNVIKVSSGERQDNTTYNISINSHEIETKIVGDGSNKVTVRQWNR
jgi:hypothetical protein